MPKPGGSWLLSVRLSLLVLCVGLGTLGSAGCGTQPEQGPGHRQQRLALTPEQELSLGRQAYQEILSKAGDRVLSQDHPDVQRVRTIGQRIARAAQIEPLQREINLHLKGYAFEWAFNVIREDVVNAFCLPGGKVGVYTGILHVMQNDDQLATVLSHEIAHALAHHASERIAQANLQQQALEAATRSLASLGEGNQQRLISVLSAGTTLNSLAHDRFQESEADHIGLFLMTFAGYEPEQSLAFWERMHDLSARRRQPPEVLSTHPHDERRLAQLRAWVPQARAAKQAYDEGRVAQPVPR